jgi:hypothetical protein
MVGGRKTEKGGVNRGLDRRLKVKNWIPACAGMTNIKLKTRRK